MTSKAAPNRVPNFSAGPATIPTAVLERAQSELLDWQGRGMSVMEVSHRSKEYVTITEKAEAKLRSLMDIPDNYKVLFLQGGASLQFSAIPLNLLNGGRGDYLTTVHGQVKQSKKPSAMPNWVLVRLMRSLPVKTAILLMCRLKAIGT